MNYIKQATTVEEQLEILGKRGVIIDNREKATENLLDIGYFRLGFYCFPFEQTHPTKTNRTHQYKEGTRFDQLVKLYYFDVDLRNLLNKYLFRIEINFRTYLIYTVSNKYINSPTWFVDPSIVNNNYVNTFETKIYTAQFKKNSVIKYHHQNHINDRYAPAWKTLEFMTLGNILVLYKELKDRTLQYEIAKYYGFKSINTFLNYMEVLRNIRNTCAHNAALFDISLPLSIANGPAGKMESDKNKLSGAIKVLSYMVSRVSTNRESDFNAEVSTLFRESSCEIKEIITKCSGITID